MKLPENYIADLVKEIGDGGALSLILLIKDKENVSEFKIAEKLNISVNQVRRILYFLSEYNLVAFTRKKDKKKGWYIYFWTFDSPRALNLIIELKHKKITLHEEQLKREERENFVKCKNNCVRFNELEALEAGFKCPECGEVLVREDNKLKKIEDLKKRVATLKNELNDLCILKSSFQKSVEIKPTKKPFKKKQDHKKAQAKKKKEVPKKNDRTPLPKKKNFVSVRHKKHFIGLKRMFFKRRSK